MKIYQMLIHVISYFIKLEAEIEAQNAVCFILVKLLIKCKMQNSYKYHLSLFYLIFTQS